MAGTRHAVLAAAPVLAAASPAQASPFDLLTAGGTALGAWSFSGPTVCGDGPDPTAPAWPPPVTTIVCVSRLDALLFRTASGDPYLTTYASTDRPAIFSVQHPSYYALGNLASGNWLIGDSSLPDWQFVGFDDDYVAYLISEANKPQWFWGSWEYYLGDLPGAPPGPLNGYANLRVTLQPVAISAVPEPTTLLLVASGALVVGAIARRRRPT